MPALMPGIDGMSVDFQLSLRGRLGQLVGPDVFSRARCGELCLSALLAHPRKTSSH